MGANAGAKFHNRAQAGALLGDTLAAQGVGADAVVLGLLRGGLAVAAPLAARLGAGLGALAVRKLGVPGQPEVAFGAIAAYRSHTARYLVASVYERARLIGPESALTEVEARAGIDLERLAARFAAFAPPLEGRTVVLCDDGLATGATMHAALEVAGKCGAGQAVVAVPVAPRGAVQAMRGAAAVISLRTPREFTAVGAHYEDFGQVDEQAVDRLLREATGRG